MRLRSNARGSNTPVSHGRATLALLLVIGASPAKPEVSPPPPESLVVTATKLPEEIAIVPAMVSVVSGQELTDRNVRDLRGALALVSGVDVGPGGDAGPAASVPGMWGLKEFDAFLLVVDGVPYGGAFNPAVATLDLTNVARIEVLRGAAPVTYGATSFVGVIHVIHSAAGETPTRGSVAVGSPGTASADFATNLPPIGRYLQSLTLNGESREFTQDDSKVDRVHLLYRGASDLSTGKLRVDFDVTVLRQDPYSPHPREGSSLTPRFPLDANSNPKDARQDQDRAQLNLGLSHEFSFAIWDTTLSVARTEGDNTRGFLRDDFATDGTTPNADGFQQSIDTTDLYFDSYLTFRTPPYIRWVAGVDWLYGKGKQESSNFEYAVLPDGSNRPDSSSLNIDETTALEVERNFGGLYTEIQWTPDDRWNVVAGLRLNRTEERRDSEFAATDGSESDSGHDRLDETKASGAIGVSFSLWHANADYVTTFADYRDTYKPAAVDFGPEAEGEILQPETGDSWEAGLRSRMMDGRFAWEASYFHMNFENLVVRENVDGLPALANAGSERFTGVEAEAIYWLTDSVRLLASYAYHDAVFVDYLRLQPDGSVQQLAGNRLELSPEHLGALGIVLAPEVGFVASVVWNYTGQRFLNKSNTAVAEAFETLDAGVGYRWRGWELRVDGYNLTDSRDPATESELGDAQFYRLPGRTVLGSVTVNFSR
jgi:iron complex outermembrane receptor protein